MVTQVVFLENIKLSLINDESSWANRKQKELFGCCYGMINAPRWYNPENLVLNTSPWIRCKQRRSYWACLTGNENDCAQFVVF